MTDTPELLPHEHLAMFLLSIGWAAPHDAQWKRLAHNIDKVAQLACASRSQINPEPLQAETQPTLKVRLPIVTDELREELSGEIKLMDETGWTQIAVDFACLLQGTQTFVLSAPPPSVLSAEVMADSLFRHIKHGDEKHQAWLKENSMIWATDFLKKYGG